MPRKASGRKSATGARKTTARTTKRSEPEGPAIEAIKSKTSNPAHAEPSLETARVNAASQTAGAPIGEVQLTDRQKEGQKAVDAATKEEARIQAEAKKPPKYNKAVAKVQGQTKILREKGAPPPALGEGVHKVQQGGGGTIAGDSGQPIR